MQGHCSHRGHETARWSNAATAIAYRQGTGFLEILYEDRFLRVAFADRGSLDRILVCFTDAGLEMGHVGTVMANVSANPEQFVKTAEHLNCSAIYVTDKTVSWGNHIDFEQIALIIKDHVKGKKVTILGVSMGGFNAVVATRYIDALLCMSFCPQFSVHPDIMPQEHRYDAFVAAIEDFHIPSLEEYFNDSCVYYTFNGSQGMDRYHWEKFPVLKNARHYVFPEIDHRVARELRVRDILVPLIGACMNGDEPAKVLSGNIAYFIHEIDGVEAN